MTPIITKSKTLNYLVPNTRSYFSVSREEGGKTCTLKSGATTVMPEMSRHLTREELQDLWVLLATVIAEWPQREWIDVNTGERGPL